MNLISVEQIAKSFGERSLFQGISFGINEGQKIGFVARNGTGKTTFLKLLTGEEQADEGQIVTRKGLRLAYLKQADTLDASLSIKDIVNSSEIPAVEVIRNYEKCLEHPEDEKALQAAFEQMEKYQGWDFDSRLEQVLHRLQLEDQDQRIGQMSGGQRKRLALALVLLQEPEVMVLDEPTNHLDLEMIEWLENWLKKESLSLFMVTHDRYFLDRVCDQILELDQGQLYKYKGNYSYFLEKKQERLTLERLSQSKAKSLYKKELDWMRRQPKARTTKSKSRIDDFFKIKELAKKRRQEHEVQLEINMERLGSKILELHKVSKSFGDRRLIRDFDYVFKRGERVGVIGKNGSGKTTLLNLITGALQPDTGKVVHGDTLKIGYYTQDGLKPVAGQKVIEVIKNFGEMIPLKKGKVLSAAQLLERFLFDRKKQYDFVEKLSGGELKRLFLCTVLIQNPNFLILDEPTNDLDIMTLQVLENFLLDYPGNVLIVSHDRYFMDRIVDHLFVLKEGAEMIDFPGNYSDYRAYEDPSSKTVEDQTASTENPKKETSRHQSLLSKKEQNELKRLEREIKRHQDEKMELELKFADPSLSQDDIGQLSKEMESLLNSISDKEERWMELSLKAEG